MFRALVPAVMAVAFVLPVNSLVTFAHDSDHMSDWGRGWWIAMMFMMVIFWAVVIALVVWGVRSVAGPKEQHKTPLDIARERLAKGEMSEEEFERIKRQLM